VKSAGVADKSRRRVSRGPLVRTLLVAYFCAGIATLGLLSGGEHPQARARREADPMRGYYPAGMPRYPDVRELPSGADTSMGRARGRMSYFSTRDDVDRVADFYGRFWRERGFWVRDDVTHRGGVVSAVDGEHHRVYQVLIARQGGYCQVFPSILDDPLQATQPAAQPPPIALFPRSEVVLNLATSADDKRARSLLSVNEGTVQENVAHYRSVLQAAGYEEELSNERAARSGKLPNKAQQSLQMLVFRKESTGDEATVSIARAEAGQTRVHLMMVEPK